MPNGPVNPLQPLTDGARQINEQLNQAAKALGDSFTQTTNQLLATAAQGLPALPPLPGTQGSNPGHNGRGNGNGFANGNGFPTLQQLVPTQALQAVSQVEDVLFPPGVPRPSQALLGAARPRRVAPPPEEPAPVEPERPMRAAAARGVEGVNGRDESRRRALGVQAI